MTISIAGEEGREPRRCPSAIRDPQPGLAQPDRPVWVLAAGYPRLAGELDGPAGAETASPKTFDFGPLKPGETVEAVWKLSAVKTGDFEVLYEVGAGLGGKAKAETAAGPRRAAPSRSRSPSAAPTPKSPTAAKSSKSARRAGEDAMAKSGK